MTILYAISFIGGLAMLLFGMHVLTGGLCRLADSKLSYVLDSMTSSPWKGILWGTGITGVIQSSAVTTVTVVGLINAGIIRLRQAIAIIMGANIGTTMTAWILSIAGIHQSRFILRFLQPDIIGPVLAFTGVVFLLFSHRDRGRSIAATFMGFALLLYGMAVMVQVTTYLAEDDVFLSIVHTFHHPLLYIVIGFLVTVLLQSSSISIGIIQAAAVAGLMHLDCALMALVGMELGATIVALISGVGTSLGAKRAALSHFLFNLIGAVLFLLLFGISYLILGRTFFSQPVTIYGIAVAHTLFNVLAAVCLLPGLGFFEKLVCFFLPDQEDPGQEAIVLDKRFFETPSFAAQKGKDATVELMSLVYENLSDALSLLYGYDKDVCRHLKETKHRIDEYEQKLREYLARLSCKELSEEDGDALALMLCSVVLLKRMSAIAVRIGEGSATHAKANTSVVPDAELSLVCEYVQGILKDTLMSWVRQNDSLQRSKVAKARELALRSKANSVELLNEKAYSTEDALFYMAFADGLAEIAACCDELSSYIFCSDLFLLS